VGVRGAELSVIYIMGEPSSLFVTLSVDVGSTTTKVAYFDHARGVVEVVEINGAKSMPSAVFYEQAQKWRFGKHALSRPAKQCQVSYLKSLPLLRAKLIANELNTRSLAINY
jgi:molecular chaperone DnaK (HSP70)